MMGMIIITIKIIMVTMTMIIMQVGCLVFAEGENVPPASSEPQLGLGSDTRRRSDKRKFTTSRPQQRLPRHWWSTWCDDHANPCEKKKSFDNEIMMMMMLLLLLLLLLLLGAWCLVLGAWWMAVVVVGGWWLVVGGWWLVAPRRLMSPLRWKPMARSWF